MDGQKRSAPEDAQTAPKLKRQAVAVNGLPSRSEENFPKDEDLDRYQKDAILRQMREYKREKSNLETLLAQASKRAEYHDDHLRVIDAWFLQLLDELALLHNQIPPEQAPDRRAFRNALVSAEPKQFETHLRQRSQEIKAAIQILFSSGPSAPPDVTELQERLASLLVSEKAHATELQRNVEEKGKFEDRLEKATLRYMSAEKQLDRRKSSQVAKLEAQAIASSKPNATSSGKSSPRDTKATEAIVDNGPALQAAEIAKQEAEAVAVKRKEQAERLAEENKQLTEELTAARAKSVTNIDDEYAGSELFKQLKAQHVDVIKRINDLEAKNIELREEAKKLHAERTEYKEKVDDENRDTIIDMQSQLAQVEADLARIRNVRDELVADQSVKKAEADRYQKSFDLLRETADSYKSRITVLESEVERSRRRDEDMSMQRKDTLPGDDALQASLKSAESEKTSLEQELRSMEVAWKKTSALAAIKVQEVTDSEEKIGRLSAEKAKADQKYFATMKLKETREWELKTMKDKNDKSSQIISQLKDTETSCRSMLVNVEKQLAEAKSSLQQVTNDLRKAQQQATESKVSTETSAKQSTEIQKQLTTKDEALITSKKSQREAEVRSEELTVRLEQSTKDIEAWKKKALSNTTEEYDSLKQMLYCTVCRKNFKDTALTTCGHVMCKECIDKQIALRQRRCPNCNKAFGANDYLSITL